MAGVAAFALPGLGCSALLPLTIGLGQEQLESIAAAAAGGIIAFYQVGFGIAALAVGPLLVDGVHHAAINGVAAAGPAAMGLLPFASGRAPPPGSVGAEPDRARFHLGERGQRGPAHLYRGHPSLLMRGTQ